MDLGEGINGPRGRDIDPQIGFPDFCQDNNRVFKPNIRYYSCSTSPPRMSGSQQIPAWLVFVEDVCAAAGYNHTAGNGMDWYLVPYLVRWKPLRLNDVVRIVANHQSKLRKDDTSPVPPAATLYYLISHSSFSSPHAGLETVKVRILEIHSAPQTWASWYSVHLNRRNHGWCKVKVVASWSRWYPEFRFPIHSVYPKDHTLRLTRD